MINDKGILNHYIESKKLINEARHDGQLVIFVGAGASICSGMLTWGQAIKEIASHLGRYINEFDMGKGIDETGKIIRNLAYGQNMRIRLADNKQALNEEEIEKKERINKLLKDFKPEECDKEKIQAVLHILAKSDVCYIELYSPLENRNSWHRDCIELANYDPPDWVDAMNTFDYQVLENIIDKNNAHLAESRPQLYMEQGYLYYVLKEYLVAYNCFKMPAGFWR